MNTIYLQVMHKERNLLSQLKWWIRLGKSSLKAQVPKAPPATGLYSAP